MQVWTAALPCSSCTWKPSRVWCAEARHAPTHSAIQSPRSPPCCFCEKSYRNDFVFLLTLHSVFDEKIKPSMFVLGCIPNIFKKKKKKSQLSLCFLVTHSFLKVTMSSLTCTRKTKQSVPHHLQEKIPTSRPAGPQTAEVHFRGVSSDAVPSRCRIGPAAFEVTPFHTVLFQRAVLAVI